MTEKENKMDIVTITTGVTVGIIAIFVACACLGIAFEYRKDDNYDFKRTLGSIMHLVESIERGSSSVTFADIRKEIDRDAAIYNQAALRHRYHAKWLHIWATIGALAACFVFVCGLFLDNYIQTKVSESYQAGNQHGLSLAQGILEASHVVENGTE